MPYIEISFSSKDPDQKELLTAILPEFGFEGFEEEPEELKAYILATVYGGIDLVEILKPYSNLSDIKYEEKELADQNWNELWEKSYEPVCIGDEVHIRASFHPESHAKYDIVIDPKMAFGTGHHHTTAMMMELMLEDNLTGMTVLDFGSGTGILSILAEKVGAEEVYAIDHEQWAFENIIENIASNQASRIKPILGDQHNIPEVNYDYILANVNKNIILDILETLACRAKTQAIVLLSGLLVEDKPQILSKSEKLGLTFAEEKRSAEWICLKLKKDAR